MATSSTPATHCTVVVMASTLRVPTEPSALRIALEGVARKRRHVGLARGDRQRVEPGGRRHLQQPLVDPASGGDVLQGAADDDAVADALRRPWPDRPSPPCAPAARVRAGRRRRAVPCPRSGRHRCQQWRRCHARPCARAPARSLCGPCRACPLDSMPNRNLEGYRSCAGGASTGADAASACGGLSDGGGGTTVAVAGSGGGAANFSV